MNITEMLVSITVSGEGEVAYGLYVTESAKAKIDGGEYCYDVFVGKDSNLEINDGYFYVNLRFYSFFV